MNIKHYVILAARHTLIVNNDVRNRTEKRDYFGKLLLNEKIDLGIRIFYPKCTAERLCQDDIAERGEPYDKYLFNLKRC